MRILNPSALFSLAVALVSVSVLMVITGRTPALSATTAPAATQPIRVLIIAGGTSHDFKRWFETFDADVLKAAGCAVTITEDPAVATMQLAQADVALVSTNKTGMDTQEFRKALFDFAQSNHGLVLLHPATWYNYDKWPLYNARLVGGGTHSHDAIAPFTITILQKDHPVMAGVPDHFEVIDELYHINPATCPTGTVPIDVLAQTSVSKQYHMAHPSIWIPRSDHGRVVCIAPGHDGRVHKLEAFQRVLVNAVKWTAEK